MIKHKLLGVLAATGIAVGALAIGAPAAQAYGPSYCNASSCMLSGDAGTDQAYFEMPRYTSVSMVCWTDNQWWDGTNRWFKVNTIYGSGFMNANQVGGQTIVGHC